MEDGAAFVLTADLGLARNGRVRAKAVVTIGVSRTERLAVIRRIRRTPGLVFVPPGGFGLMPLMKLFSAAAVSAKHRNERR